MSRHQLRRRIRAGTISSRQVQGPHGLSYEVLLDRDAVTLTPPLTELVNLLRDSQRQNVELAGLVGSLQQRLAYAEDRVRMLEAPRPASPEMPSGRDSEHAANETTHTASGPPGRPWWRFS